MFYMKYVIYFIWIHLILCTPQLNLYYTSDINENYNELQHHCLRLIKAIPSDISEIMLYCMSELPTNVNNIEKNDFFSKLTFTELLKQNVTSEELYLWSAPIDIIEDYQFYLNQFSTKNDLSLGEKAFYNCTLPRFGPMCQYQLYSYYPYHSSLLEIIDDFYHIYRYNPTNLTCYIYLECNRGSSLLCLDWSEICDGKIDCLDGGFDEEHCWQLEINQCEDNEYRCQNGQCIPQSFYTDGWSSPYCIDISDVVSESARRLGYCSPDEPEGPSFSCEDLSCQSYLFPGVCSNNRRKLLIESMFSIKDFSISEKCWPALKCVFNKTSSEYSFCNELCKHDQCINMVQNICPDMIFFPNVPILFGNIYLAYIKNDLQYLIEFSTVPLYICYNSSQYDDFFVNTSKIFFNNMKCINSESFLSLGYSPSYLIMNGIYNSIIDELYKLLKQYHLTFNYTTEICNRSNMYQCINSSKCISIYRLLDTSPDCPNMDDENMTLINNNSKLIKYFEKSLFKCETSGKYIHQSLKANGYCDCGFSERSIWCEDEHLYINYLKRNIVFQHICDGFADLIPKEINGKNESDETECQQWKCVNIYTRCNDDWNCPNGEDETNCDLNCPLKHHLCVSPETNQFTCLSVEKANDGNIDCLGGTDEPTLCKRYTQSKASAEISAFSFYCMNQSGESCTNEPKLCDGNNDCEHRDDEQFCTINGTSIEDGICSLSGYDKASDIEKFFCNYRVIDRYWGIIYFKLDKMIDSVENQVNNMENVVHSEKSTEHEPRCHRGLDLLVWLNDKNNSTIDRCLCPLSFYGSQCEYQNQRLSLTVVFQSLSSSLQIPFTIIIFLIDNSDQRIIHSYEQMNYLSVRDCGRKKNLYLVYSTRPKDPKKIYSIHIDIYEKLTFNFRGSLLFPIHFPFLPVYRLSFIVNIPRSNDKNQICSNRQCIHGKCIKYSNKPKNFTFCLCDPGWTGKYCTIKHTCQCSLDSLCIGISSNNRSICVCPVHKFGPRCFLTDGICEIKNKSKCENGGQCISNFDYKVSNEEFYCICRKGFNGKRCEIEEKKIILSFDKNLILSQQISIHFIRINSGVDSTEVMNSTERTTTFRRIPVKQDSIIIPWSKPFHIIFIEFTPKTYYLTAIEYIYNESTSLNKIISPSNRCPNIIELFNQSFVKMDLIRRIKYYHLPCENQSLNLSCFYDESHFCLCYEFENQRLSNCFKFDHEILFDCKDQNECENDADCIQDDLDCPKKSLCLCRPCFYGSRCQFRTRGFGLSIDAILGYQIVPNVTLNQQPFIIKMSLSFTIIFMIIGLLDGIISLITFKNKSIREVGCGLYLLGSSITTLSTTIIFSLKFIILLLSQMNNLSNRLFLEIQCYSMDFLLQIFLSLDQWLNACVALERAITTIKGAGFVKKKSKQAAKLVILILLIVITGSFIHDPIYRHLIDEDNDFDDDKRIWCIVSYPFGLQIFNNFVYSFHFFGPFIINLASSIILITKQSRRQARLYPNQAYKEILRRQFLEHKHLLIGPIVSVVLALPRLIITFLSKCMKSANDSWLFLLAYFVSLIPPMLTFAMFILPSKFYMKELGKTIDRYQTNIQRHLRLTS